MTNTTVQPNQSYKKPPGPKAAWLGFPLLRELVSEPLASVQRLHAQYGDVMHLRVVNENFYYVFAPELIREALVEHADDFIRHERAIDVFTRFYGANVLTTEASAWKRQRRILMPGFLPKRVAGYLTLMTAAMNANLDSRFARGDGESTVIDVGNFTRKLTIDVILHVLFSHQASEADAMQALQATLTLEHQAMRELYWPATPPDWLPYPGKKDKLRAIATLQNLIGEQISARIDGRARQADKADNQDYLAMLLSAQDEEAQNQSAAKLTQDEIRDNCMVIFAAGHDTTATALTWWIALMAQHPEYAARARAEVEAVIGERAPTPEDLSRLTWLNASFKETLRLYPPAPLLFVRRVMQDLQLGEWRIPKGANLSVPVWHVHHDPRYFDQPEVFRPERFMAGAPEIARGAYLPFGTGPRVCIGQHLATMEMALIGALLLREFDIAFHDRDAMPDAKVDMVLTPAQDLMVRFTRRARRADQRPHNDLALAAGT